MTIRTIQGPDGPMPIADEGKCAIQITFQFQASENYRLPESQEDLLDDLYDAEDLSIINHRQTYRPHNIDALLAD